MRATDTNILVRFLTADDADQFQRAQRFLQSGPVFVASTVLLETEWTLRSVYRYRPLRVADALEAIAGLPMVTIEHPERLAQALAWLRAGLEFADAFHLAATEDCEAFMTFDRGLVRRAAALSPVPVQEP